MWLFAAPFCLGMTTLFVYAWGEDIARAVARGWYTGRCQAGACPDGCPCEDDEETEP
jgi:hypothetical protein